jgi:hypothetical protein
MQSAVSIGSLSGSTSVSHVIEVARDTQQVLARRRDWERLSQYPDSDVDFFLAAIQTDEAALRPHVISVRDKNGVSSVLMARLEKRALPLKLGYVNLPSPRLRLLTTVHGGLLGDQNAPNMNLLLNAIVDALKSGEADAACFHGLEHGNALHQALENAGSFWTRDAHPVPLQRWRVRLPKTYDEFLRSRSSNTRHNVKRYSKRFIEAFQGQWAIRSFSAPDEVEAMLADTEAVAQNTYHRGLGVGFIINEQTRAISLLSAQKRWLRAHILYVNGKPCAFWNGWLYGRTFFTWTTGFDPTLNDSRPGMFLLQHMFRELCAEGCVDEVDFGLGDAQYKRDWCDFHCKQVSQLLFARSFKSTSFNLLRRPLVAASATAESVLGHTTAVQKLKKAWRDRSATMKK